VFIRLVVVSLFLALLANCAARPGPETFVQSSVAPDGWGRGIADSEPARPKPRRVVQRATSAEPKTTGSATTGAAGRDGINPHTPEWYAVQDAEAERLKRLSNICRC
jgi:hypothetical protein